MSFFRWLALSFMIIWGWSAQAAPLTLFPSAVSRYTDLGAGVVRNETGSLHSDGNGFVPVGSTDGDLATWGLTSDVLTAISSKTVVSLTAWLAFENAVDLSNFKRSDETYIIDGGSYVIVSVKGSVPPVPIGAGDEVLKLNMTGTTYCQQLKPKKFRPKTDIDLWLKVESDTSAILYGDQGLTEEIATLNLESSAITTKKVSFVGTFSGSGKQLSILGIFALDHEGFVKSTKAVLIQKKVFDTCYSQASVIGKRIVAP